MSLRKIMWKNILSASSTGDEAQTDKVKYAVQLKDGSYRARWGRTTQSLSKAKKYRNKEHAIEVASTIKGANIVTL